MSGQVTVRARLVHVRIDRHVATAIADADAAASGGHAGQRGDRASEDAAGHAAILREAAAARAALSCARDAHLRHRRRGVHRFAPVRAAVRARRRRDRLRQLRSLLPARRQGKEPDQAARRAEVHVRRGRHPRRRGAGPRVRGASSRRWSSTWRRWRASARRWPSRRATPTSTSPERSACSTPSRAHGVARFVFGSSSSVYGRDSQPPFKESDPCLTPLSPYAATKRANELMLFTAHHLYAVRRHLPALLHRVRPAPAARPGDPQVRAADGGGEADPAVRRRLDVARLHVRRRHHRRRRGRHRPAARRARPASASTTSAARARRR